MALRCERKRPGTLWMYRTLVVLVYGAGKIQMHYIILTENFAVKIESGATGENPLNYRARRTFPHYFLCGVRI
jgi:hypothetical protein